MIDFSAPPKLWAPSKPAIIRPAEFPLTGAIMPGLIFFPPAGAVVTEAVVSGATGTDYVGDMTGRSGLAAAFNGASNVSVGSCASNQVNTTTTFVYTGRKYAAGKAMTRVLAYGSNNSGYKASGSLTIELRVYAKNGAPSNSTDGTRMDASFPTFVQVSDESSSREITISDNWAKYTHWWVAGRSPGYSVADDFSYAELVFYENISA